MAIITEQQLQESLQTQIQTLSSFANHHVVINDYALMDEKATVERICIIENSPSPENLQVSGNCSSGTISIPASIMVRFVDWKESLDILRDMRQEVWSLANGVTGLRGLCLEGVMIDAVTVEGGLLQVKNHPDAQLPIWIAYLLNFNIELF